MKIIKTLFLIALLFFGQYLWDLRSSHMQTDNGAETQDFVDVAMPMEAPHNTVIILAPANCPSDAAQRAEKLADALTHMGIPNVRRSEYSAHFIDASPEQEESLQRAVAILKGDIPAVFINGRAKANPSVEEVVAEFHREQK